MIGTIAEILINRPSKHLNKTFSYKIPDHLSYVGSGWLCIVPFAGKQEEGIILSCHEEEFSHISYKLLEIYDAIDSVPWFTDAMIKTAKWISQYYMCTLIDALRLFLIDKKGIRTEVLYEINWKEIPECEDIWGLIDISVEIISKEDAVLVLGKTRCNRYLAKGFIKETELLQKVYKEPLEEWLAINNKSESESMKRGGRQKALWSHLCQIGQDSISSLISAGFSRDVIRRFCRNGNGHLFYRGKKTFSLVENKKSDNPRKLTEEQKYAVEYIIGAVNEERYKGILLYGVTGSGKTEVYLRAAESAIAAGGTVLLEVPEIALTNQMVSYFADYFGDKVVFMHSNLSKGERYNNRQRIANEESSIIIGSRSALFMPFKNLKLIIVDEEYDSSYKQTETPRYNGRDVAKVMAVIYNCPIVLGAATPSVTTFFAAKNKKIELLEMRQRVHKIPLPQIYVYDMRSEADIGHATNLSRPLIDLLRDTVQKNHKAILLLNRRGFAPTLMCKHCGYVFKCTHCDVPLVYHKDKHRLNCHYCESTFPLPRQCPVCSSQDILYLGWGTQRIEEDLKKLLPEAKCCRFDADSTAKKYSAAKILSNFRDGKFDILFGTQMVAKGHDIPGVQSVGILSVDSTLNMPTYLAAEQTFNLITQCAGRAGRNLEQGRVILQTYNTEHYVILTAAKQDYDAFYQQELEYRRTLHYPPFTRLMKITCFNKKESIARNHAEKIYRYIREMLPDIPDYISVTPPYDEPVKKVRNIYNVSLLIKGNTLRRLKLSMQNSKIFQENDIIIDVDPL
ncbi:primosomal protein N' [Dialister invisus]|uniref:replication restart helicase PriA n=1 Tax=Dialister invisus TaxID=218538 RepID=UPI0039A04F06